FVRLGAGFRALISDQIRHQTLVAGGTFLQFDRARAHGRASFGNSPCRCTGPVFVHNTERDIVDEGGGVRRTRRLTILCCTALGTVRKFWCAGIWLAILLDRRWPPAPAPHRAGSWRLNRAPGRRRESQCVSQS